MMGPKQPAPLQTGARTSRVISNGTLTLIGLMAILMLAVILTLLADFLMRGITPRRESAQDANVGRIAEAAPRAAAGEHRDRTNSTGGVLVVTPTPTSMPRATAADLLRPSAALPSEVLLRAVPIGKQTRTLNCEFQAASDLAWYYGRPFTWEEIFQYVGHDPGGNPHKGFVGRSFDDQPGQVYPFGYGVYAEPIAQAFARLGLKAEVFYHQPREWLMAQIADGRPVMIWATSNMTIRPVVTWTAADGVIVKGVPGEHTYLAIGYDAAGVWLTDPWDGQQRHFAWDVFLASWDLLDRMALVVSGDIPVGPPSTPDASRSSR